MNVLLAPDSFKGSLTALRAAETIAAVITRLDPAVRCVLRPQADGGEGTVDAIFRAVGGRLHLTTVHDPLGRPVQARWLQLPDGSALVESAACIGLTLLAGDEHDPRLLRSDGLGMLLRDLAERGYSTVYCGLGGTATNDAGYGLATALGARFQLSIEAPRGVRDALASVRAIEMPHRAAQAITALADVDNPLLGPRGATAVYGPQKGIPEPEIQEWDHAIGHFAAVARRDVRAVDPDAPGMGAAGGLGFALACFAGARIHSGAAFVRRHSGFDDVLAFADLVITGEGRIDAQSTQGKVLTGLRDAAAGRGVPIVAFCGEVVGDVDTLTHDLGLSAIVPITSPDTSRANAMREAERLLADAVVRAWPVISAS